MKIAIKYLILYLLALSTVIAQEEEEYSDDELVGRQIKWDIDIGYTKVDDKQYASDAVNLEITWYPIGGIYLDAPELWDNAVLSLGPTLAIRANSGIMNNDAYAEQIKVLTGGVASRIDFLESYLSLDLTFGVLDADYTLKSGYEDSRTHFIMSSKLSYFQYSGRLLGEAFFPTWGISAAFGLPWSDQRVFDWGYNELQHRQNETGNNISSIHLLGEMGLVDAIFSDDLLLGVSGRGLAGKYNSDIYYFGVGGGLDLVIRGNTAFSFKLDKIWGWDNNKSNNMYLTFVIPYSFYQQIHDFNISQINEINNQNRSYR